MCNSFAPPRLLPSSLFPGVTMWRRSSHPGQDTSSSGRGFRGSKTQKNYFHRNLYPSPSPTLSSSLRESLSPSVGVTSTIQGSSRVRLGENGEWVPDRIYGGNFVNYLPQDEAVAVGLGSNEGGLVPIESQRVVDLLNRELGKLLKLNPRDFWRQVAADLSLHEFLDSFLQFRSRWFDFPYHGAKGIVAGVIVGDGELSRRVFMVLHRISSNKDPGVRAADGLSHRDHGVLLQEKKLLELPKLLDICAIYGHENEDLTRSLVVNAIHAQPWIHGTLTAMMCHFLDIVHTMNRRCSSSLEALSSAGGFEDHGSTQKHVGYLEIMDFLNDAVVSMDAFIDAFKPAAFFFSCPIDTSEGTEELINVLATLHDSLLPSLERGLQTILASGDKPSSMLSNVAVSVKLLSSRMVDLGWKLLDNCYLMDELFEGQLLFPAAMKMFPASVEDPVIRADILIQTFKEIASVPQHDQGKIHRGTFLQNIERHHQLMQKIDSLQSNAWILIDDEQYHYLAALMTHPMSAHPMSALSLKASVAPTSGKVNGLERAEDEAVVESKVSQVKDLFPDYGNGFITACLEAYDHNPEEVIQRILEGTLHEDLQSLNSSMEIPPRKPAPSLLERDKGKGKLIESAALPYQATNSKPQKQKLEAIKLSTSSSSYLPLIGRFTRKSKDGEDHKTFDSGDEMHKDKTSASLSQFEYEDEYDDSFDDLGMTMVESGTEATEILGERINSSMSISARAETQSSAPSAASFRWNSRKKPQFYVKDGKNYGYKIAGSIAVADEKQASLITQAQKETIHGLGRGGNFSFGVAKNLAEQNEVQGDESDPLEMDSGNNGGRGRGSSRGRRGGGGRNHFRKARAMKKHMAGVGGF